MPCSLCLSPSLHMFPNLEAPQTLPFWVFMGASLHRCYRLNHWPMVADLNLQAFILSPSRGFQCSYCACSPWYQPPFLVAWGLFKSPLNDRTKNNLWCSSLRKFQGFWGLCSSNRMRTKHIFLINNSISCGIFSFGIRGMLDSYNEFGSVLFSSIFFLELLKKDLY